MGVILEVDRWAQEQFGDCELGDKRRTRRVVQWAANMAAAPDASTPCQQGNWSDLKAAYRLADCSDVTFDRLAEPHWQQTRKQTAGTWLILGDTTAADFGYLNQAQGLGPLGKGLGRGFLLHSGLMVDPVTEEVVGLAGQRIRYRKARAVGESSYQALKRDRESLLWGELIEQIGVPPPDVRFVHIFDRGADNFEVFCRLLLTQNDWVIRAGQLGRKLIDGRTFEEHLAELTLAGSYELTMRATQKKAKRTAKLEVRYGTVAIAAPRFCSPWLQNTGIASIVMNVVEVREVDPPADVESLHWVLLTSLPVSNFDDAWKIIEYYEKRPIIEEFHKALKTGCQLESRQYQTSTRLECVTALLSVVAVRLLQLRSVARSDPQRPAWEVVPLYWIKALQCLRRNRQVETVQQFYRELAGLGGFLGRKHDGQPGWITIWRGFKSLHIAVQTIQEFHNCG